MGPAEQHGGEALASPGEAVVCRRSVCLYPSRTECRECSGQADLQEGWWHLLSLHPRADEHGEGPLLPGVMETPSPQRTHCGAWPPPPMVPWRSKPWAICSACCSPQHDRALSMTPSLGWGPAALAEETEACIVGGCTAMPGHGAMALL